MSDYQDTFNAAKARFRNKGVAGQEANDETYFRETSATQHELKDASKNVHVDSSGFVVIGGRNIKTKMPTEHSMYGIIDAGLNKNEPKSNKET